MLENTWQNIVHFVTIWGSNSLVAAIFGALLALSVAFFRQIGRFISSMFKWLRAIVSKQGKDYSFERAYLKWMIDQHRYLGLLPARALASWGEDGRNVDLEKVYVSLHVSSQIGDKSRTETYTKDPSSWCKKSWFYIVLKVPISFYILSFSLLVILEVILVFFSFFYSSISIIHAVVTPLALVGTVLAILFMLLILCVLIMWRRPLREETYQLGDLALAIESHKQLVIRGDPGSGKTTLLRYLAVTCARALRNSKRLGDASDVVKKRLLWTTRPFPILITLRRYSNVALWDENKRLLDVFAEELPAELRKDCPVGFFGRKLAHGNCLILLDAFDELGTPEARAAMARRINDFRSRYDHPRNRVVVTTRIVGYEGQLDRYGFQIRTVQHLQAGEIRALIKQRYEAIALSETAGWQPHDAAPIKQDMQRRSERLIKKVESTPRLAQLATNPLLLSLIVLVHRVKVELPEERVLLYRDCVEILTEQWQRSKRAESDMPAETQEELNLSQKLVLLQALALSMQQQRAHEHLQTLLPQLHAQQIIASKLPDILGSQLPVAEDERREVCRRKAETWVKDIQEESGILVEQGLDAAGEPLIGFSHLTFQEYLAALSINETPSHLPLLTSHLLQPTWREVVLLYVALTSDATSIVVQLLNAPQQPAGIVLAGLCLAEKLKHVKNEVQHLALTKLKDSFELADEAMAQTFGPILAAIGGADVTVFMRAQLHNTMPVKRLEAINALAQLKSGDPLLKDVQQDLVQLLETPNDVTIMIATREALAQIGDPRFTGDAPVMVSIPQQTIAIPSSPRGWKELFASLEWVRAKKLRQRITLLRRVFDYWSFSRFHRLRRQLPDKQAFAIGKYPVTNIEYARFIVATGHSAPKYWIEGTYATEKSTCPVTGVTIKDANNYCKWLSQKTGETYRLPTEWEWEWAATGSQGCAYPWGEQFDKNRCNTGDAAIGETTPVGSYLTGINQYGLTDMSGNIWEINQGYLSSLSAFLIFLVSLTGLFTIIFLFLIGFFSSISTALTDFVAIFLSCPIFILASPSSRILRGGAFNTSSDQATCFFRKKYVESTRNVGFRCVKDV